jgi:type VI protein secretion system component Hcp
VPGVTGGSRNKSYPNWFELSEFGFSVTAGSSGPAWTLGFTTVLGQGVDQLYNLASDEQATDGVQLAYATMDPTGTKLLSIFTLTLRQAMFASSSTSAASSAQTPGVTFTLTFGGVDMTFNTYDNTGAQTSQTTGTWDVLTNKGGGGGPGPELQFSVGSGGHSHILDVTSFLPPSQSAGAYGSGAATLPLAAPAPEVLSDIFLAASGKVVPNGVGQLWKVVSGNAEDYATYSFTNATLQSVSISGATATIGFSSPSVSFTLANPQGP